MAYSNNEMTYNKNVHRYVLKKNYVLEDMNIDLSAVLNTSDVVDTANAADKFLDRVSLLVYGYVYRVVPFRYKAERDLALDEKNRPFIRDAMKEQILYILNNGDFSGLAGVNLDTGMTIDRKRMRDAEIAPVAKDILIDTGIVRAFIPIAEREITPKYQEENY